MINHKITFSDLHTYPEHTSNEMEATTPQAKIRWRMRDDGIEITVLPDGHESEFHFEPNANTLDDTVRNALQTTNDVLQELSTSQTKKETL